MPSDDLSRRSFLKTIPIALAGFKAMANAETARPGVAAKWSSGTDAPHTKVPLNATDCHHHIIDARYPIIPNSRKMPDALVSDYRLLQKRLGITRHVIIQFSSYGVDNRLLVESLRDFGLQTTRGVAVVNTGVTDAELKELDAAGVRGIRCNMFPITLVTWEMVEPLAKRIAPMGWHIQILASATDIVQRKDLWKRLPCPIVFDHMGHVPQPEGMKHPVFGVITDMLHSGKGWTKISGLDDDTKIGPPTYADILEIVTAYVREAPGRLVWGTNWPHTLQKVDQKPDDSVLFDAFAKAVPDDKIRNRILVDNAAILYRF